MSLVLICGDCGKEAPASACVNGKCIICVTSDAVQPLLAEYRRLWSKRERYSAKRVDCGPVEKQLATVARRVGDQVHRRISNGQLAISILNAHLEDARNQVEHPSKRILLPKPGMLVRA